MLSKRLEILDYGRFAAALSVIIFHYTFNGIANGKIDSLSHIPWLVDITKYGYLGVEFFFMISGYVIFCSAAKRSAASFAVTRAKRLYPAYWFGVVFTSFFAWQWGGELMSVSIPQILVNFSMLQQLVGVTNVDGAYWTLFYELVFYAAVFFILLIGAQRYLRTIFIFWPVVFLLAGAVGFDRYPYLGGYFYFFSAGALFAVVRSKVCAKSFVSLLIVFVLCVYSSASKAPALNSAKGVEYSATIIAILITGFFCLFIVQNNEKMSNLRLPMSRLAGDLTYPIYLIHAHFGYMFLSQFATDQNRIYMYPVTILLVIGIAWMINNFIEKSLSDFWLRFFNRIIRSPVSFLQSLATEGLKAQGIKQK